MKPNWVCRICGEIHDDVPICFGTDAPWRAFVPEGEFDHRVELTTSLCVIDEAHFFVRGHIEIPIHDHPEALVFSVWSSVSEASFSHINERWSAPDRATDQPYFGWLCSPIRVYPDTIHLKLSVQSQYPGLVPLFHVDPASDHPVAADQRAGISAERWHRLVLQLMDNG